MKKVDIENNKLEKNLHKQNEKKTSINLSS